MHVEMVEPMVVTSAGGDGDGVVVCRVNGVGCHLTFLSFGRGHSR